VVAGTHSFEWFKKSAHTPIGAREGARAEDRVEREEPLEHVKEVRKDDELEREEVRSEDAQGGWWSSCSIIQKQ
jgi:hypothetical protein